MSDTLAVPTREVVEAALGALAKKLRAELILGVLEDFAGGRCTARVMFAEFRGAERTLTTPRPAASTEADRGLEALVAAADAAGIPGGPAVEDARRYLSGGTPQWDRLREISRDRERPAAEWEIFTALHKLAQYGGRTPDGLRAIDLQDVEEAMDLTSGLGESWSLHEYLRETRDRFGPSYRPDAPEVVAGIILRVDACRQLLKPGGFTAGITPGPAAPIRTIDSRTMQALSQNVQRTVAEHVTVAFALGLLRNGHPSRREQADGLGPRPPAEELNRALDAGAAIVRARTAREMAERARGRAAELRGQRLAAGSTALYATAVTAGLGLTAISLLSGARFQLTAVIGIVMAGLGAAANTIKDWTPNSPALISPLRAWVTEEYAKTAEQLEHGQVDRLHHGGPGSAAQRAAAVFDTARADALGRASRRLEPGRRARSAVVPPVGRPQPNTPKHRRQPRQ